MSAPPAPAPGRRLRQTVLGLAVGAVAMAVALWGVPLADIAGALQGADPLLLAVPAGMFLVQQLIRAARQALLLQATHPAHRLRSSLSVLCVSFFFINVLPARAGEVVRPLLLAERDGIPLGTGFAMVVVERALDLCAMCLMVAIAASTLPPEAGARLSLAGLPGLDGAGGLPVLATLQGLAVVGMVGVAGALLALLLGGAPLLSRLGRAWPADRQPALRARVLGFGGAFAAGLEAGRSPRRLAPVLGLSALTWVVTVAMYPALARALGAPGLVGPTAGVGVLGFTMMGMALPAAPGFAGTYEAFARAGLALYGVAGSAAVAPGGPSLDAFALAFVLTMHWGVHLVQSATAVFFLAVDRIDPVAVARRAWRGDAQADARSVPSSPSP